MVRDINGLGGYSGPKTVVDQGAKKPAATTSSTTANAPAAGAGEGDVQISSEAKTLQTLAAEVNSLPEVNLERADKIKAALEQGEYQIDDLVLADKIINSEALFGK